MTYTKDAKVQAGDPNSSWNRSPLGFGASLTRDEDRERNWLGVTVHLPVRRPSSCRLLHGLASMIFRVVPDETYTNAWSRKGDCEASVRKRIRIRTEARETVQQFKRMSWQTDGFKKGEAGRDSVRRARRLAVVPEMQLDQSLALQASSKLWYCSDGVHVVGRGIKRSAPTIEVKEMVPWPFDHILRFNLWYQYCRISLQADYVSPEFILPA
ncbi:hypothetical protein B0H12DRAFT_1072416 [Mycena haematopus]|nr:hypothetical protein B0H12DRAFT_1072416 [Mycena haematopus]